MLLQEITVSKLAYLSFPNVNSAFASCLEHGNDAHERNSGTAVLGQLQ